MRTQARFEKPSTPPISVLEHYADKEMWKAAIREAERSPMGGYRTGAVIVSPSGEIISKGCSHPSMSSKMNSIHAERHCLIGAHQLDLRGSTCIVYTKSARSGGSSWTSRPCISCAKALVKRGVERAIYPVRDQDSGLWRVDVDYMEDIMDSPAPSQSFFARNLVR